MVGHFHIIHMIHMIHMHPHASTCIRGIDGCRFALVFPIVVAHFARFSTSNLTALKLLTQENVLVGGFFVISGYVSAYTTTKLGALGVEEKKVANPELFFWQRVAWYHLVMTWSCGTPCACQDVSREYVLSQCMFRDGQAC